MGAQATATVEQAWLASSALPGGLDGHAATVAGAVFAVAGSAPVQRRVAPPARAELAAVVSMLNALNAVDPFVTRLILSRTLGLTWSELQRSYGRSMLKLRAHQATGVAHLAGAFVGDGL